MLESGYRVSGFVLGPEGEPVAGASVGLDGGGSGVYFGGRETTISGPLNKNRMRLRNMLRIVLLILLQFFSPCQPPL